MAVQKLKLSRAQLAAFLPDQESVKQFEQLFRVGDTVAPGGNVEVVEVASSALVAAMDAEYTALAADKRSRRNEVMLWLSM